jgi:hypothetical protein
VPQKEKTVVKREVEVRTVVVMTTAPEKSKHKHEQQKAQKGKGSLPETLSTTVPTTTSPPPLLVPTLPVPGVTLPVPPKKPHPPKGGKTDGWATTFHSDQKAWICSAHHCK